MPRIPDTEIEQLKAEVSVERLVEGSGVELKKSGKDMLGRCPFHEDGEPSLVVTPGKNLWHCFGCGIGGGPIDWVIKQRGVSFRHAVELLREGLPSLAAGQPGQTPVHAHATTTRSLSPPVALDADDQQLLDETVDYYHQRLKATMMVEGSAWAYLVGRGLDHPEVVDHFKLGVADRSLGLRLPEKNRKAGADIRARLQRVGLLRESGHEHFNGSLVIPVVGLDGRVREVYGRKLLDNLRVGTPKHLYLPGPHAGVFNEAGLVGGGQGGEVILCEASIDALTFWCAGYRHVTSSFGVEGFTDDIVAAFKGHGVRRVLIAYDRDEAGDRGAAKVAATLMAEGLDCWRIEFPRGMDANSYARKVQPAGKSLGLLIRQAVWLGNGDAPARVAQSAQPEVWPEARPVVPDSLPVSSLAAGVVDAGPVAELAPVMAAPVALPAPTVVLPASPLPEALSEPEVVVEGDVLKLVCGDGAHRHVWQVRGLPKAHPGAVLKLNVRVQREGARQGQQAAQSTTVPLLHVDSVDLYSARSRAVFVAQAAAELGYTPGKDEARARELGQQLGQQLGRVLLAVEQAIEERARQALTPKEPPPAQMSEAEHTQALAWLKLPNLLPRILADFDACGLVGEATNKLTAYLACVSRLLASPLAVVVQSSSAAGKTSLMDAVLAFMPTESRIRYSAMTGQSLYYMGQTNLKHRILALAEEEGASRASYALKLLQSDGELTMAATGKDPTTGNLVTQEYHVEGPVMLMLTTTAIDIDEELMNRCLVLTVDEGAAQTQAIHARQRQARTLSGLLARQGKDSIVKLHRNAQRLLRPLAVVNPYAEQLSFAAEHTRARRDHQKYLALIDAIALLHQHQRPIKTLAQPGGAELAYIEVTRGDIEAAHAIAHEVLGRSTDELPPVTRKLLFALGGWVASRAASEGVARAEVRFTRRALREALGGWGDTQLRLHLERLGELEYVVSERGGLGTHGGQVRYSLRWDGPLLDGEDAMDASHRSHLCGLVDPSTLPATLFSPSAALGTTSSATTREVAGLHGEVAVASEELAGQLRPMCGADSGGVRGEEWGAAPALTGLGGQWQAKGGKTHRYEDAGKAGLVLSYPQDGHAA